MKKTADDKEIKSTYRNLAKQHHPDLNPDNKQADEKFREISAAYKRQPHGIQTDVFSLLNNDDGE